MKKSAVKTDKFNKSSLFCKYCAKIQEDKNHMVDFIKIADELNRHLIDGNDDGLLKITARYRTAERQEISNAFQAHHGRIVSEAIKMYCKKGPFQNLMSMAWEPYPEMKAQNLTTLMKGGKNPKAICDYILTTNPDEWDYITRYYQNSTGRDLSNDLLQELGSKMFWARLCLSWIAFRRAPRNDPAGDAETLRVALSGKKADEDAVIQLLGTTTPDEWARISKAFEVSTSRTVHDCMRTVFKGNDLTAAHTAHHFLNNANEGAAYLIFRAVEEKGDVERCARATAMYYDKCPHVKLNYAIFGNLARDIRKVFKNNFGEACCTMWGVL
ncbi:Hypothetical protein GSB_5649 [Giardia duodenalis]|uniref:Alpha-10 giardin n=2 Tax=Giardia intestinalis TaxID=5741 RepID=C6LUM2_GIAIB|nr:Alpha-10 giardin [Giardia intestinalis ATCC 50581]ESU42928.1 Hypothetical protein GSB_5649 [Giardia intestinalis]